MDECKEASTENILGSLQSIYWKGVGREVCEAALAYRKIEQEYPDLSPYEKRDGNSDFSGANFKNICSLLTPWTGGADGFDSDELHRRATDKAKEHLEIDVQRRRARYLLQAIGLLDIDAVHDSMNDTTIGRHNHHPLGEKIETPDGACFFREMVCLRCKWSLRGTFYYECKQGCFSENGHTGDEPYVENQKGSVVVRYNIAEELQQQLFQPPNRRCPACIVSVKEFASCERKHYKKIYPKEKAKGQAAFESRLRGREFQKPTSQGGSYEPTLKRVIPQILSPSWYAQAGPLHFALMFGPLMIENGVPHSLGGALISCRPVPSLQFQAPNMQYISTEEDAEADSRDDTLVAYVFNDEASDARLIKTCYRRKSDRRFLGYAKKVVGGAFSGHDEIFAGKEEKIIDQFLAATNSLPERLDPNVAAPVRHHRTKLAKLVEPVIGIIKETYSRQVDIYLQHFAQVLKNINTRLKWELKTNNCQHFNTKLLKGLLIDRVVPLGFFKDEAVRNNNNWQSPRYCISFGPRMDTALALLRPQRRSIVWNFYHEKRDYCDIIEFGEGFRTKSSPIPTDTWEVLDGIDDKEAQKVSLADALWSVPRDAISILQTHLHRSAPRYSTMEGKALSESEWYSNRLRVYYQLDVFLSLSGGLVRALSEQAAEKQNLIPEAFMINTIEFNILHASEKIWHPSSRYHDLYYISGRERAWMMLLVKHYVKKLFTKAG
ncbi:hypothetical protein P171DRAFT_436152 [Karstenula rhodostoma CBS 690.94]|uniref:Uncharacterized protein n=1 Tax=Karstenula rhodostoma CBS 690.94 TaxID=1392251 RepID=A0A9P4P6X4_9PLEO|nr:hypothetical protein P171DRAFT_436152 [Karstenula rhodostoma CBS 690.94]